MKGEERGLPLLASMHIVHLQGAVKGGELLSLDEPMMIEVFFFTIGLDTGTRMDEGNLLSCKSIHVNICKKNIYIYIYQHRQRGPTVFLEVDIFKGSHYGNPYSQGRSYQLLKTYVLDIVRYICRYSLVILSNNPIPSITSSHLAALRRHRLDQLNILERGSEGANGSRWKCSRRKLTVHKMTA